MVNKRVRNAVLGCNLKNDRMISVRFQGKPFNITVIQVYAPTSNAEEAERFYEDLQDLLELTTKKEVMLKILQARLQEYMNCELPDVQAGFSESRGTKDQIANICWIFEKAREFQKDIYFCFTDYAKAFDCVDHNKLWKMLQEMGIPDHLTCLLGNVYAGQEATVRTRHGTIDWLQIRKGVCQDCILSPCLFNLYAEYIM